MTNKNRTIQACKDLAEKYRKPQGKRFFNCADCALCRVHLRGSEKGACNGCPLGDDKDMFGCNYFESNKKARQVSEKYAPGKPLVYPNSKKVSIKFIRRAEFFEKIIPILEKIPGSRFTNKGWKYFKELDRKW